MQNTNITLESFNNDLNNNELQKLTKELSIATCNRKKCNPAAYQEILLKMHRILETTENLNVDVHAEETYLETTTPMRISLGRLAARVGDIDILQKLKERNIQAIDSERISPECHWKKPGAYKKYKEQFPDDPIHKGCCRVSLAHEAAEYNQVGVLQFLLENGEQLRKQDCAGCIPLHWAAAGKHYGNIDAIVFLSDNNSLPHKNGVKESFQDAIERIYGLFPLIHNKEVAIFNERQQQLSAFFSSVSAWPDVLTAEITAYLTPLKGAEKIHIKDYLNGRGGLASAMTNTITEGTFIDFKKLHKLLPLNKVAASCAMKNSRIDILQYLIDNNIEVFPKKNPTWYLHDVEIIKLFYKTKPEEFEAYEFAYEAIKEDNIKILKYCHSVCPDFYLKNPIALVYETIHRLKDIKILKFLASIGVDIGATDDTHIPLHDLVTSHQLTFYQKQDVEWLYFFKERECNFEIRDSKGYTLAGLAATKGNVRCLEILYRMGCDLDLCSLDQTAMQLIQDYDAEQNYLFRSGSFRTMIQTIDEERQKILLRLKFSLQI